MRFAVIIALAASSWLAAGDRARAQTYVDPLGPPGEYSGGIVGQFDDSRDQIVLNPVTVSSQITPAAADRPAILMITARVAEGRHIYSITQPPGGPTRTKIELAPSTDYRLLAPFTAHPGPKSHVEKGPVWAGVEIQEHEGKVTWHAPIELTAGVDPKALEIRGKVRMDVCETGGYCEPVNKDFTARLVENSGIQLPATAYAGQSAISGARGGATGSASALGAPPSEISGGIYQAPGSEVKIIGRLEPATVRPGQSTQLVITATPAQGWHVYAHAPRDDKPGSKPTLIALASTSGLLPNRAATDAPVIVDDSVPLFGPMQYHEGEVTWTMPLDVPQNALPGEYRIHGLVGYQGCETREDGKGTCELPRAARFEGMVQVTSGAAETSGGSVPLTFAPAENYGEAAAVAAVLADFLDTRSPADSRDINSPDAQAVATERAREDVPAVRSADLYDLERVEVDPATGSLAYYIAIAFVGGLILNLMPCVLPVISLKVMSFVEQAGHNRARALMLNVWYAVGIIGVFLLLGILAVTINLAWGGQFGSTPFNVTIAAVVFAMALSLLGVWEVPIPGFFGSGTAQELAAKEGPAGAIAKGVVTTVLATPCTAPFMAPAIAWAVAQPAATTLFVFASLGLGMASPYLLVGVYPELLRFMPRPGRWMETFRQVTGFVLLATVVFILSYMEPAAVVPTVAVLMGVGVACWLVSRTPLTAERRDKLQTWALAAAVLLAFVVVSFGPFYRDIMRPRFADQRTARAAVGGQWQPFSLERLKEVAVNNGRTVLVDFSADWCFNCKVLERAVLHTETVEQAIEKSGAVTMYADFTDYPPEVERTIRALRASGVPVIAVFPGNAPYQPIVFRGGYTQGGLIEALEKATGRRLRMESGAVAEAHAATRPQM